MRQIKKTCFFGGMGEYQMIYDEVLNFKQIKKNIHEQINFGKLQTHIIL